MGVAAACATFALSAGPAYADEPVRIWTDATGPLFAATNLAPGSARTACLAIGYQGRDDTSPRMAASTSGGGLAGYLDLTVAVGTGGRYGDCSAFVGSEVYSGTLADFATRYADPSAGLALDGGAPAPTGTVSIRVTIRMQNDTRAQGQVVDSSFVWYAVGSGGDPVSPPEEPPDVQVPVTGPEPAGPPAVTPTPAPTPVSPTATPKPTPSTSPSAVATATPPGQPPGSSGAAGGGRRPFFERLLDSVSDTVREAAPAVFKGARLPLYLLPLVLLFLLIQNEIDRRDPKLTLAPAYADPDLPFDYDPTSAKA